MKLKVLDLFSGIGGFSLGLERTGGFETVAFCEIEPFCQKVLNKHWPEVKQYHDITSAKFTENVDLVTAGFPCQDISFNGKGAGLTGDRSGLFWYIIRTLCMVGRPRVFMENVAGLLNRGLGSVLGALATFGYDAQWDCIRASDVGLIHQRDRIWITANPEEKRPVKSLEGLAAPRRARELRRSFREVWLSGGDKSRVCGEYDGLPHWLDRNMSLGNAVVPQIPEIIGYAILETTGETHDIHGTLSRGSYTDDQG